MPPLTGLVGIYGTEISQAGKIACQEVNENGGVLGRPLELVVEDDGSLPESAVAAASRLVDQHRCAAIIGNLLSNSRIAVAYRVAEPRRIPYLNFSFYEGSISSRYFFHFAALPNQQIDRMIPYMREKYGPRMFFAGNNYEWPRGSIDAAKLALVRAGGEVVGEEYCPIGVDLADMERLLDHIDAAAPDVFVPYFAGTDQVNLLIRFTQRGLKMRMAVVMGHYDEMMASKLAPEVRDGFYSSNTYFMTVDSVENRNTLARLSAQPGVTGIWPHGNGILTNFGEGTYICVKAFAQAANAAGSLHPEALVDALKTIHVSGPQGLVHMDPATHHAAVNTYLSRCQADGVFAIVEKFGAIEPVLPERYNHERISHQATLEEDIRLQARILEQMSEAVLLSNAKDGTIVYGNAGAQRMFGHSKGELNGKDVSLLYAPSDRTPGATATEITRILSTKAAWQGEIRCNKKDGALIWCSVTISTFTHPVHGELWMGVHRDITERKRADAALREREQMLEAFFEYSPDAIIVVNRDGHISRVNRLAKNLFGYERDEFKNMTIETLMPERYSKNHVHHRNNYHVNPGSRAMGTGLELYARRKDGTEFPVDIMLSPVEMSEGSVVTVVRDITVRKRAEEEIRKAENRYRSTLDYMLEGCQIISYDWRYLYLNDVAASQGRYPKAKLLGRTMMEMYPGIENTQFFADLRRCMEKRIHHRMENEFTFPDGSKGWFNLNIEPVPEGAFILSEDITKEKQLNEELRIHREHLEELVEERTAQLQAANKELESFSYSVSHDLRAPLRHIDGFADLLTKHASNALDNEGRRFLQTISDSAKQMGVLIDELLVFSRMGRVEMRATTIDPNKIVRAEIERLKGETRNRNIEWKVDELPKIKADEAMVKLVFQNLLENAVKYTRPRKNATIEIGFTQTPNECEFFVKDNGVGFDMQYLDKLFGVFQRLHRIDEFEGTGIGLANVRRIIQRHGGRTWAEGKVGEGATIYFSLPNHQRG